MRHPHLLVPAAVLALSLAAGVAVAGEIPNSAFAIGADAVALEQPATRSHKAPVQLPAPSYGPALDFPTEPMFGGGPRPGFGRIGLGRSPSRGEPRRLEPVGDRGKSRPQPGVVAGVVVGVVVVGAFVGGIAYTAAHLFD